MTKGTQDLSELLARVKAATGPSRQLDIDLWEGLGFSIKYRGAATFFMDSSLKRFAKNEFTASIDAALALVEKQGFYIVNLDRAGPLKELAWRVLIWAGDADAMWQGPRCQHAPLAILAALLIAQQEQEAG